ncbi:platelet-activating factor acetylhydrolase isoform II [Kribbella voronezhensis]|uniref:Platelet-activating factor acetylhydrolase isoform II n=1 Tax=Kribbella voronezhensis TaxID=2512212 RepID=A0A4R7T964_9ACTN|nr:hypothetical protein [Kribbella voronezhensis]TDU87727.1 platelet-activating factor acetylhydrolase isoform II [Kribbella voronezhensis]
MLRNHAVATIAAVGLAVATMLAMPAHGRTSGWHDTFSPSLPYLDGPHQVGARRKLLTDESRRDPWAPAEPRHVMVDVHYPATAGSMSLEHYYLSNAATELGVLQWAPDREKQFGLVPDEVNWLFRTHGHEWAPIADGRYPVVLLSAGPGRRRTDWRSLAEELAGQGYVVVSVDHSYDSAVVELFPTRRVVSPADATTNVSAAVADDNRARDLRYVATHLADVDADVARVADLSRIGFVGWVGLGTRASRILTAMPGVRAIAAIGAVPDGARGDSSTPLLVLAPRSTRIPSVPGAWRVVTMDGTTECGLTDDGIVLAEIAKAYPRTAAAVEREIGTVPAGNAVHRYVRAFLDLQLRGLSDGAFEARPPAGITVSR